jgi:hypothetical protein
MRQLFEVIFIELELGGCKEMDEHIFEKVVHDKLFDERLLVFLD